MKHFSIIIPLMLLLSCSSKKSDLSINVLSEDEYRQMNDRSLEFTPSSREFEFKYIEDLTGKFITLKFDSTNITDGYNLDFIRYWMKLPEGKTRYSFSVDFFKEPVDGGIYKSKEFKVTEFKWWYINPVI